MNNSFYYFFSAVPQVLAGILALFGVFVIFKIQSLKSELIGIGQSIIDETNLLMSRMSLPATQRLMRIPEFPGIIDEIKKYIIRNEIKALKSAIENLDKQHFKNYQIKYFEVYDFLHTLIKKTVNWSLFNGIIITICLGSIPFGSFLIKNQCLLYILFSLVIVCIVIILFGLISILREAISISN